MIVICPKDKKEYILDLFETEIKDINLEIQNQKTQIFHFNRKGNSLICGQEFSEAINPNKNLIYLGLEFDGSSIRLKSASISGFYRKMKRSIKRAKHFAGNPCNKYHKILFKSRILKRFSYKGSQRRRKYLWDKNDKFFKISTHYDWGNFLSYADKASKIKLNNKIKKQTKKHWKKIEKLLKK
jgi:hypothetical protein